MLVVQGEDQALARGLGFCKRKIELAELVKLGLGALDHSPFRLALLEVPEGVTTYIAIS